MRSHRRARFSSAEVQAKYLGRNERTTEETLDWTTRDFASIARAIASEDPLLAERVEEFLCLYSWVIQALAECGALRRLHGLHPLGFKARRNLAPQSVRFLDGERECASSQTYNRWVHSVYVAAHGLVLALRLECTYFECLCVVVGGLLHDSQHPALGHDTDHLLVLAGRASHEVRGMRLVMRDPEIGAVLTRAGLRREAVCAVIEERGQLGTVQKIADTLGYLVLDTGALGIPLGFHFSRAVIGVIERIEADVIVTTRPETLEYFLDTRAIMYRDVYYGEKRVIAAAFCSAVVLHLVQRGVCAYDALEHWTDNELVRHLSSTVERLGVPWVSHAWETACAGVVDQQIWEYAEYSHVSSVLRHLASVSPVVVQAPVHFLQKSFTVRVPNVGTRFVSANSALFSVFTTRWHTFTYRGR